MAPLRVVCVKWGNRYGPEWVYRLQAMVAQNLAISHDFLCVTDDPIPGIDCIDCAPDLPGWWAKIGLFRPGLLGGLNLYFDLDVIIRENIDGLLETAKPGRLSARDDFSYSLVSPKAGIGDETRRLLGGVGTINSSVMLWHDDDARKVWDDFRPEKMEEVHGDQNWITQALWPEHLNLIPNAWICSYKYHVLRGEPVAPVVVFHGEPKVTQLSSDDPLRRIWESSWQ